MAQSANTLDRQISSFVSASNPNPLSGMVLESDLAAELRVHVRTLRRWEVQRIGPARTKLGKTIYYSRAAIEQWLKDRTSKPCRTRSSRRAA